MTPLPRNRLQLPSWTRLDVIHRSFLAATDSLLFKEGKLEVYAQVAPRLFLHVAHGTRLPRSLDRFEGVLSSILHRGGSSLLSLLQLSLPQLLSRLPSPYFFLDQHASRFYQPLVSQLSSATFLVGANVHSLPPSSSDPLNFSQPSVLRLTLSPSHELSASSVIAYVLSSLHLLHFSPSPPSASFSSSSSFFSPSLSNK